MQKFIPIFPLNLVAYPGEKLNLHIFEPRYIQLINECNTEGKTFGIPVVNNKELLEYGTEMKLEKVQKVRYRRNGYRSSRSSGFSGAGGN